MRDPYVAGLRASPSLRCPTPSERVRALVSAGIVACAALVIVSLVVAAFVAVGLDTPRGQVAAALCVVGGAIGGWAWRSR